MTNANGELDLVIVGRRVRAERRRRGMTLDQLAERSRVSRSMLSAVEAGAKAPTVVVLHRIAQGLGLGMARLLGEEQVGPVVLLRREEQIVARDPSGWERRNLSPVLPGVGFEFMRTTIPAGVDAGVFPSHGLGSREYLAVERGALRLTIAETAYDLRTGDAIYYEADRDHAFANPGAEACIYYLTVDAPAGIAATGHQPAPDTNGGDA